jgi:hypothetical protein
MDRNAQKSSLLKNLNKRIVFDTLWIFIVGTVLIATGVAAQKQVKDFGTKWVVHKSNAPDLIYRGELEP